MRFYVYELIDSRTGDPFYVGKGTGNRMDAHEREARSGVSSEKCNKIREIWASGSEVSKKQVAFFFDARDAYSFETQRIHEIGLSRLTNVAPAQAIAERKSRLEPYLSAHFLRCLALFIRVANGLQPLPPDSRPFAKALYAAVQIRGYKPMLTKALEQVGFARLSEAIRPFGVVLRGS